MTVWTCPACGYPAEDEAAMHRHIALLPRWLSVSHSLVMADEPIRWLQRLLAPR